MADDIYNIEQKPGTYYKADRTDMLEYIPRAARKILEVGCGEGGFGRVIKEGKKAELWGVELRTNVAKEARKFFDRVIVGDIESDFLNLPQAYFDCIIFNDVLEHLLYPWVVLKKMRQYLSRHGYIIASIPNVRHIENIKNLIRNKDWKYTDEGILDKTHLRFFTEKSARRLIEESGYRIIRMDRIHPAPVYWKFKLLNWLMKNDLDDMKYLHFACVAEKI